MTERHGQPVPGVDLETWLGDDPALALVHADMHAWSLAHPCECEAMCTCDDESVSAGEHAAPDE